MRKKWFFIVNPIAGNGEAIKLSKILPEIINIYKIDGKIVYTEGKGHAGVLAEEALKQEFYYIAPIGGDGTFHETIQKIVNYENFIFAPIPAGTGNDFISILGFSEKFTKNDWDLYFSTPTISMDIGLCNDKYFLNGMGIGFDAQVALENYKFNHDIKVKKGSKNKYIWHILKTLLLFREDEMKLIINNQTTFKKSFLNTISNGRRLAGGFYLTPKAYANDGLLDVCMISELNLFQRVKELISVIKRTHLYDPCVKYYQINNLFIEFDHKVAYHLDGELYFDDKFHISILPEKIKIVYNINGSHYFIDK